MTRIYRYVLKRDCGMAPNPRGKFITLATCKPQIRSSAKDGDWIVGYFPAPHNDRVAWAGIVKRCVTVGEYGNEHGSRDDALYPFNDSNKPERVAGKHIWYHPTEYEQGKDKKGNVLIFDPESSWYFGENGRHLPEELLHLAARGRPYLVNGSRASDAERLHDWLSRQGKPGILGKPRDGWAGANKKPCSGMRSTKRQRPVC